MDVTATAPGRVNLIGDHVDYAGGLVLPMAIDLTTTVSGQRGGERVVLMSGSEVEPAVVPLGVDDPSSVQPEWARYVAGVMAELGTTEGLAGEVQTTIPPGAGLSSSAALEVAVALALGAPSDDPLALARLCQRAEHRATGVPCGIMDQLVSAAGVAGHAVLIDCAVGTVTPVPMPSHAEVVVVHSGQRRGLTESAYAERRAAVERAAEVLGPLRHAGVADVEGIDDEMVRRRARHVITEISRVRSAVDALRTGDLAGLGELMVESHMSLRDDFDVSTDRLDGLVERLSVLPGVHGARLTGAGFGGCVVALCDPGALDVTVFNAAWVVQLTAGAHLT